MNSYLHAKASVKRWGGSEEDYLPIHELIDESKKMLGDVRHRALLHNTWGIWVVQLVFGPVIKLGNGRDVPVREIAEQHIIEDLGFIPTVERWLENLPLEPWMSGARKRSVDPESFGITISMTRGEKTPLEGPGIMNCGEFE